MIEKKTTVNQIEVQDASLHVRFALLLVEDGAELQRKWHRTSVEQGGDIDAQIAAVNEHLAQMGYGAVPDEGVARIKAVASAVGLSSPG